MMMISIHFVGTNVHMSQRNSICLQPKNQIIIMKNYCTKFFDREIVEHWNILLILLMFISSHLIKCDEFSHRYPHRFNLVHFDFDHKDY